MSSIVQEMDAARPVVLAAIEDAVTAAVARQALEQGEYEMRSVTRGSDLPSMLAAVIPDVVLLDADWPEAMALLTALRSRFGQLPVIVLSGQGETAEVTRLIAAGASDYVVPPFSEVRLRTVVGNATALHRASTRLATLERQLDHGGYPGIPGRSAEMRELFRKLDRVAKSEITVLIEGESGTGKELVARAIHAQSGRPGPFVALNCAAIPESLQESELFGHERGAFTGAVARRLGKFEQAHRGTLLLDEIAELSPALQAKLLRVLQERSFVRVGGTETIRTDIRVIAASHRDLSAEVRAGRFREDLYFRIAVLELAVPPLRDRDGDVVLLAHQFLAEADAGRHAERSFALDALEAMVTYPWPGNVRELLNAVQRAAVLATGDLITLADLPERIRTWVAQGTVEGAPATPPPATAPAEEPRAGVPRDMLIEPGMTLAEIERRAIELAFRRLSGNISAMSRELEIGRTALYRKLRQYAADPVRPRSGSPPPAS